MGVTGVPAWTAPGRLRPAASRTGVGRTVCPAAEVATGSVSPLTTASELLSGTTGCASGAASGGMAPFRCAGSGLRPWLLGVLTHVDPPEGTWVRRTAPRWVVSRPGGSRTPADVRPMLRDVRRSPVAGSRRPCEVACPPHVTPDRHRVDEPDGRRVVDLARRGRASAQGHRGGRPGAAGRDGRCRLAGRRRRRPRGNRDPVAHGGEACSLPGEGGGADRGQGHPQAGAGRVGHPRTGLGQATTRRRRRAKGAAGRRPRGEPRRRGPQRDDRGDRGDGGDRPGGGRGPRRPGGRRPGETEGRPARGDRPAVPTSTVHRNAMLATLRPEQIPVAEQLLRGGLQAVRQAIEAQNSAAKAVGKPPVAADALIGDGRGAAARGPPGGLEGPRVGGADRRQGLPPAGAAGGRGRVAHRHPRRRGARHGQGTAGVARPAHDRPARGVAGPYHERPERRTGAAGRRGLHPTSRARYTVPGRAGGPAWPVPPERP